MNDQVHNLKPCPFCGSTDIVIARNQGFFSGGYALCQGCFATTRSSVSTDEAVANWNRRTHDGHKCSERIDKE
nr:MAG TPA: restriction alleviation protein [Caudoviricetes sp.]